MQQGQVRGVPADGDVVDDEIGPCARRDRPGQGRRRVLHLRGDVPVEQHRAIDGPLPGYAGVEPAVAARLLLGAAWRVDPQPVGRHHRAVRVQDPAALHHRDRGSVARQRVSEPVLEPERGQTGRRSARTTGSDGPSPVPPRPPQPRRHPSAQAAVRPCERADDRGPGRGVLRHRHAYQRPRHRVRLDVVARTARRVRPAPVLADVGHQRTARIQRRRPGEVRRGVQRTAHESTRPAAWSASIAV